ncbi:LPXTG-motif cell wall anchor domain protein [Kribbella flavida DSM 17836]|uniref:LPXTG-motif cell wall anchor domain protein n=1 Tax=Kribbella flavida (strain DSM 17836 / JCM 10339 / NBRC 14399) TaxID=479435 RepID=D2PM86_KRIFD|nr:Ig-like domain-containing protein [Kribbella flavida]ADB34454.1 LPXTG-motif cell wall anchor domain protein [Kribbella flavida DSM 17836]
MKGSNWGRRVAALALLLALLLALTATPAAAYQVPAGPFTQGSTATATMPGSGLTQTITTTGRTELLDATTAGVRGIPAGTHQPAIARTTPAQDVLVGTGDCAATGSCGGRGTLTIAFSQPVRDPVLHVAGLGGSATRTVDGQVRGQSELHAVLRLTTPGVSLRKLGKGNNLAVTSDTVGAADPDAGPSCSSTDTGDGPDARATAACGSVQVNGVVRSVAFDLTAVFTPNPKLPAFNTTSSADVFSVVATVGEDFGDAPRAYGAAWSVLSDLRLGAEVSQDNPGAANATTGPLVADQADDAVTFGPLHTSATTYSAAVGLTAASKPGRVCGWIDLDRDGAFELTERTCVTFAAGQGEVNLSWAELPRPVRGQTTARIRAGYTAAQVEKPTGAADSGEVEDHLVTIVPPPAPVAAADTVRTPYDTGVTTDVLGNDQAGDPSTLLQPGSVCLVSGTTCRPMAIVVGQGKYVVKPEGRIDFDPVPGFVGVATPVTYRVTDSNGMTARATLTVTVALPARPIATADTATTPQNVSIGLAPLANDKAATGVTFDAGSVVLRDPADTAFKPKVVIPAEGSYTVKPDGGVDFVPLPQFTGVATTVGYRVADSTGQPVESTLVVTVTPVTPRAAGDSVSTPFDTNALVPVLDNDQPGSADAPLDPATLVLVDPATGKLVPKVTVGRQGEFQVAEGRIAFAPAPAYKGSTTPLTYQVLDQNGTPTRAELVVSVDAPGPPVANPDTISTLQGGPVYAAVLDNDKPGPTGSALTVDSVRLLVPTRSEPGTAVVVAGQGKYSVRPDGRILFEPVPMFHGKSTPVRYQVSDGNGAVASAALTVEVTGVQPDATDDTARTAYDKNVTVRVLANDTAGDPLVPLVPSSVRLIDPVGEGAKQVVTVDGQATYTATADGTVEVDPVPTFTGVATPLTYTVSDVNGTLARATLTVTIAKPPAPIAKPDSSGTQQDVPVRIDALANDNAGEGTGLDPLSLVLMDPADGSLKKVVTTAGEGRWQVDPDGTVVFDPVPAFTGIATAMSYRVSDWFDQAARSKIVVSVAPVVPVAVDDNTTTPFGAPVTVRVLGNDKAGDPSAPLVPGSLRLKDPADGVLKTTVTVQGEGVFTVRSGAIVLAPHRTFSGSVTELTYQVADGNGTPTTAVVRITVGAPPVARPDTASTVQDVAATVNVLANDSPGTAADLDPASVVLRDAAARSQRFGRAVTVPGQGTYAVRPSGAIVFDPLPAFRGTARPITYQVADSNKSVATATVALTVTPVDPFTVDDSAITSFGQSITVDVLANDKAGDPSAPLVAAGLVLKDPQDGAYRKTVTQPGEGRYTTDSSGRITFTPASKYQGVTTPATYRVADDNGTTAEGLLFLTVGNGPEARPDTATTGQNRALTVDVLANDVPGTDAQLEKTSVQLFGLARAWGRTVAVAGQGTFEANPTTGKITFTPVRAFSGSSSVAYQVTDTSGNKATSTITVTVTAIRPEAAADTATTAFGTPVTVPVLGNDKAGDPSAPLVPASVRLVDPATGDAVPSLRVAGQGTYTAQPDGAVRLVPDGASAGPATAVAYQVGDANGSTGTATLTVTVEDEPVARADVAQTKQHLPVTFDPLANDKPGPGATLDPATLLLVDPRGDLVRTVSVPGQGTLAVAEGKITFRPLSAFTGSSRPARYEVKDGNRNATRSTVSVTVLPVRPVATDDSAHTAYGKAVGVPVLANDQAGDPSAALDKASVVLRDPADGRHKVTVTVPAEGTFAVAPGGTVTYTPAQGFTGTTRAVGYRVTDANGTSDTASVEITVAAPAEAQAGPDSGTGSLGNPVVVNPLLNDAATQGAGWNRASVCLVTGPATCSKRLATAGTGAWTVGADGTIRLVPARGFAGIAKLTYRVTDTDGIAVDSQVKVLVGGRPAPEPAGPGPAAALPDTGGPSALMLTVGGLLAALGVTLLGIARRRSWTAEPGPPEQRDPASLTSPGSAGR